MFTGIIEAVGRIREKQAVGGDRRLCINAMDLLLDDVRLGDSISVSGVCLTVVNLEAKAFAVDVSRETLHRSVLGKLDQGAPVNLEKALRLSDRLGGHLVAGHVDGIGRLRAFRPSGRSLIYHIEAPADLMRFIASKGSICVDGISLTVNAVLKASFELNLIPHSLERTTAKFWKVGQELNLEVDLLARYLERLALVSRASGGVESAFSVEGLASKGYPA